MSRVGDRRGSPSTVYTARLMVLFRVSRRGQRPHQRQPATKGAAAAAAAVQAIPKRARAPGVVAHRSAWPMTATTIRCTSTAVTIAGRRGRLGHAGDPRRGVPAPGARPPEGPRRRPPPPGRVAPDRAQWKHDTSPTTTAASVDLLRRGRPGGNGRRSGVHGGPRATARRSRESSRTGEGGRGRGEGRPGAAETTNTVLRQAPSIRRRDRAPRAHQPTRMPHVLTPRPTAAPTAPTSWPPPRQERCGRCYRAAR